MAGGASVVAPVEISSSVLVVKQVHRSVLISP